MVIIPITDMSTIQIIPTIARSYNESQAFGCWGLLTLPRWHWQCWCLGHAVKI